jgi:sec-independent protein translocase protein TatA
MLGMQELVIILIIVVLIFGAKRIPEIMSGLGKGIRTFKKSMDDDEPIDSKPASTPVTPAAGSQTTIQEGGPKEKIEPK